MSAREVIAYAITHAGRDAKGKPIEGGPYEGPRGVGHAVPTLREAWRKSERAIVRRWLRAVRKRVPHARVIRIVWAGPSEASATLETARRRLAAVAESMTEHAYQEMASALEVDACRVEPSEASAVEVLRSFIAWVDCDPMPLARAAMRETEVEAEFFRAERMSEFLAVPRQNLNDVREERRAAVDAYRKAGGK